MSPFWSHFAATTGIGALVALFHRPPYKRVTTEPRGCLITHYQTLIRFFWSLGLALVSFCQGLQVSPAFKGPRFPSVVALRSVAHGCKGALLQPWRAQGRGSVRRPRRYGAIGWLSATASGEACTWWHVAHVYVRGRAGGGLKLQTNRRRLARLARRRGR